MSTALARRLLNIVILSPQLGEGSPAMHSFLNARSWPLEERFWPKSEDAACQPEIFREILRHKEPRMTVLCSLGITERCEGSERVRLHSFSTSTSCAPRFGRRFD